MKHNNIETIAIVTARAGSKSIVNKNVMIVKEKPLVYYPINAAKESKLIDMVFVSTDGAEIGCVAEDMDVKAIWRPPELGGDEINHGTVIRHAVEQAEKICPLLQIVVVLLGNTVMVDSCLIDRCVKKLEDNPELDSVMTVWEAADDHPLRALQIVDGILEPYGDKDRSVSTERQSYNKAYYYDQGVWAFRKQNVFMENGPNPWWWMGRKCAAVIRNWVTGRDIHTMLDVSFSEHWLNNYPSIKEL